MAYKIGPLKYNQNTKLPKDIFVNMKIFVNKGISFNYLGDNKLFSYVAVQPSKDKVRPGLNKQWHDSWIPDYYTGRPLHWWSAQLAAVIFMAATACDIDKFNLTHPDPLVRSFYIFHVYYTVRKLLYECGLPTPGDRDFDAKSNGNDQQREKLRQMLKHYGDPDDLTDFLYPDSPDGLFWNSKEKKYYFIDNKSGKKVLLKQQIMPYTDYTFKDDGIFAGLAESARKTFHTGTTKYHYVGQRKYPDFESRMTIDQYKWMKLISDSSGDFGSGGGADILRPMTTVGKILINKSLMVYFYCVIVAQSAYGGWSEETRGLIEESFAKNVNSFTTNEPRFETKNLNDYYKYAKLNSTTDANFSLGKGILLIPRDMRLKQTTTSKKVYETKESKNREVSNGDKFVDAGKQVEKGVNTSLLKPKNHNQPASEKTRHVPLKKSDDDDKSKTTNVELWLFLTGITAFYLYKSL